MLLIVTDARSRKTLSKTKAKDNTPEMVDQSRYAEDGGSKTIHQDGGSKMTGTDHATDWFHD